MQAIALHLKRLLLEKYGSATGLASAAWSSSTPMKRTRSASADAPGL